MKYTTEYEILGYYSYGYGWEAVTTETTIKEARERLKEYRENEPGTLFRIKAVRVKVGKYE